MELHFTPQVQAGLEQVARETGKPPEAFVNDLLAEYFSEQHTEVRKTLNRRYDDIESGRAQLVTGEKMRRRLREKSQAAHARNA